MKSLKTALVFGFFIWLIPFLVSMLIFPIRTNDRPLFESIMPVVVTLSTVFLLIAYFKKIDTHFLREGIVLGILWFVVSIVIDLSMFMWGPMQMSFTDYMKDIGLTYLIIPSITIGCGFVANRLTNE